MKSREELSNKEKEVGRRWGICTRMKAETFPSMSQQLKAHSLKGFYLPFIRFTTKTLPESRYARIIGPRLPLARISAAFFLY